MNRVRGNVVSRGRPSAVDVEPVGLAPGLLLTDAARSKSRR